MGPNIICGATERRSFFKKTKFLQNGGPHLKCEEMSEKTCHFFQEITHIHHLSFCPKLLFSDPFIFATRCCTDFIFKNLSFKYQKF